MRWVLGILALMSALNTLKAQEIEHNFVMGPSKTTCDSLEVEKTNAQALINTVRNTSFRYHEQLKISRYKVPQHIWYYSCDGLTGYLIAQETKEVEKIFADVSKATWQKLMETNDPITLYKKLKEDKVILEALNK